MHYSIEKFKLEDWDEIEPRKELEETLLQIKGDAICKELYTGGAMPFFTLRADGEIIVIYGFTYGGFGTFYPAVIAGRNIKKHLKKVVKSFYEYFAYYVPTHCRRMEAYCDIMDEKAIALARHFGFDIVGIRHNASVEGHDQVILERLMLTDPRKVRK